jgi:hypothetical protein
MNRVNPLYIFLLLLVLLIVLVYQHLSLQHKITQTEQEIYFLQNVAKQITTLKNYWGDKKIQRRRVFEIARTPFIRKFLQKEQNSREKYKIYLVGIDAINADRIADKIFNSFVKVNSFQIVKQTDNKVEMEVEFRF